MRFKITIRLIELSFTLTVTLSLLFAWRAERTDRAKPATELAVAQQSLTQAANRQQSRDADLLRTLAALATQKNQVQTPQQVLQALPQQIQLPQPIILA